MEIWAGALFWLKRFFCAPILDIPFAVFRANGCEVLHNSGLWSSMMMRWIFLIIPSAVASTGRPGRALSFFDAKPSLNSLIQKWMVFNVRAVSREFHRTWLWFLQPSTTTSKNVLSLQGIPLSPFSRKHFVRAPAKRKRCFGLKITRKKKYEHCKNRALLW